MFSSRGLLKYGICFSLADRKIYERLVEKKFEAAIEVVVNRRYLNLFLKTERPSVVHN